MTPKTVPEKKRWGFKGMGCPVFPCPVYETAEGVLELACFVFHAVDVTKKSHLLLGQSV